MLSGRRLTVIASRVRWGPSGLAHRLLRVGSSRERTLSPCLCSTLGTSRNHGQPHCGYRCALGRRSDRRSGALPISHLSSPAKRAGCRSTGKKRLLADGRTAKNVVGVNEFRILEAGIRTQPTTWSVTWDLRGPAPGNSATERDRAREPSHEVRTCDHPRRMMLFAGLFRVGLCLARLLW